MPIECVVRGYICRLRLEGLPEDRRDLRHSAAGRPDANPTQLPEPIFTPSTKATTGHDENISFEEDRRSVGAVAGRAR